MSVNDNSGKGEEMQALKVAMLGCGVVGTEVAARIRTRAEALAERIGAPLELSAIVVRDASKPRAGIDEKLLTTDAESAIAGADIVVELMGGIEPARSHILLGLGSGADVVTANKALLATHGPEVFEAADRVARVLAQRVRRNQRPARAAAPMTALPA